MTASFVILTTGDRPRELERAVESALTQELDGLEVVVVANGCQLDLPAPVRVVELPENVGIAEGRNEGLYASSGEVVFFLDDDAVYEGPTVAPRALALFDADPSLGIVSFRIADPETQETQRRHVPRLRVGDPTCSSEVTTFLGGACAIRRLVFDEVGDFPEAFFYAMEETDLAWRAIDAGFRVEYRGDLLVHHPATVPGRHEQALHLTARNRVWLARRRLPLPLAVVYLGVWLPLMALRSGSMSASLHVLSGAREGLRARCGSRRPIRWSTAWRMTRAGRPPIV